VIVHLAKRGRKNQLRLPSLRTLFNRSFCYNQYNPYPREKPMSNRNWLILAFVAGAAVAVSGIVYLTTRDKPGRGSGGSSEPVSSAAEAKLGAPLVDTWEYGPPRKTGDSTAAQAYREQKAGGAAVYGVEIHSKTLSPEDADSLVRFYEKYKGKSKSDAKEINSATVRWSAKTISNDAVSVRFDLATGKWRVNWYADLTNPADFFANVSAAIADVKAMKSVPFSVTP
jgi:hypothetical protein